MWFMASITLPNTFKLRLWYACPHFHLCCQVFPDMLHNLPSICWDRSRKSACIFVTLRKVDVGGGNSAVHVVQMDPWPCKTYYFYIQFILQDPKSTFLLSGYCWWFKIMPVSIMLRNRKVIIITYRICIVSVLRQITRINIFLCRMVLVVPIQQSHDLFFFFFPEMLRNVTSTQRSLMSPMSSFV